MFQTTVPFYYYILGTVRNVVERAAILLNRPIFLSQVHGYFHGDIFFPNFLYITINFLFFLMRPIYFLFVCIFTRLTNIHSALCMLSAAELYTWENGSAEEKGTNPETNVPALILVDVRSKRNSATTPSARRQLRTVCFSHQYKIYKNQWIN